LLLACLASTTILEAFSTQIDNLYDANACEVSLTLLAQISSAVLAQQLALGGGIRAEASL
jgi:hypothetical protein